MLNSNSVQLKWLASATFSLGNQVRELGEMSTMCSHRLRPKWLPCFYYYFCCCRERAAFVGITVSSQQGAKMDITWFFLQCEPMHESSNKTVLGSFALVIRGVLNLSPCYACFAHFKLPTETLQKRRCTTRFESPFSYYMATIIGLNKRFTKYCGKHGMSLYGYVLCSMGCMLSPLHMSVASYKRSQLIVRYQSPIFSWAQSLSDCTVAVQRRNPLPTIALDKECYNWCQEWDPVRHFS